MDEVNYKVGDKIVNFGEVFRVFEIKEGLNGSKKGEKVMFFKPYFKNGLSAEIVCSIPVKNIKNSQIRKPVSKERLDKCLKILKTRDLKEEFKDINAAKSLLGTNKLSDIAKFLVYVAKEIESSETVSKSKKDIYEKAINRFAQECALINKATLEKTRVKITQALQV